MTADFVRYLFSMSRTFFPPPTMSNYYPVAWNYAMKEIVLSAVLRRPCFLSPAAARKTRPAARGNIRRPGHSGCCGVAVLDCAARLGPECPAGRAVSHRLDRLGLLALSGPRAASADRAGRRLWPGASERVAGAAWRRNSRRARVAVLAVDGDPWAQLAFLTSPRRSA